MAASAAAFGAYAHTGANGVILERMNGMTAMRDVMAELAPMMQGATPYDASSISEGAGVIAGHAGETMLSLFPEGSMSGVTYAKPEIWSDWQGFKGLAEELQSYALALSEASQLANFPDSAPTEDMALSVPPEMDIPYAPAENRALWIGKLMGYGKKRADLPIPRADEGIAADEPNQRRRSPDELFARLSSTCSACHARFRQGRN